MAKIQEHFTYGKTKGRVNWKILEWVSATKLAKTRMT
jgi:hypothetical protein